MSENNLWIIKCFSFVKDGTFEIIKIGLTAFVAYWFARKQILDNKRSQQKQLLIELIGEASKNQLQATMTDVEKRFKLPFYGFEVGYLLQNEKDFRKLFNFNHATFSYYQGLKDSIMRFAITDKTPARDLTQHAKVCSELMSLFVQFLCYGRNNNYNFDFKIDEFIGPNRKIKKGKGEPFVTVSAYGIPHNKSK